MNEAKELIKDLHNVGKKKAIGYLPLETITNICHVPIESLINYAQTNNLEMIFYQNSRDYKQLQGEMRVYKGAIYFFDVSMIEAIIQKYSDVLKLANISCKTTREFVYYIMLNKVSEDIYPEAFKVIQLAFNDKRLKNNTKEMK